MRVSDKMLSQKIIDNISQNREHMYELQEQAASQKRINKPSDDPLGMSQVLFSKEEIKTLDQNSKDVHYAISFLKTTDRSLADLSNILMKTKDLALSQANDPSASSEMRRIMSSQAVQAFQHALQIANRKFGNRFIFGGFKTTQPPFDYNGIYHGDDGIIRLSITESISIPINISGEMVFGNALHDEGWESKVHRNDFRKPRSVFQVIKNLETSLKNDDTGSIQKVIEPLNELITQVIFSRSEIGAQMNRLQTLSERFKQSKINHRQWISELEDADLISLVHDMNNAQNTLKATLDSSSRLVSKNLMDFLN